MISQRNIKFQESVTPIQKIFRFSAMKMLLFLGIAGIFLVSIILSYGGRAKNDNIFKQRFVFVVVAGESLNQNELAQLCSRVKSLGGAGEILAYDYKFYVAINVYQNKADAEQIMLDSKQSFLGAEVVALEKKALNKRKQVLVKEKQIVFEYFSLFDKITYKLFELQTKFLIGELSTSGLCSEILADKLLLENIIATFDTGDKLNKYAFDNANLLLYYFNCFLDNFFISDKKQTILCNFVFLTTNCWLDFNNNL